MNFELTEEHRQLRDMVRDFAEKELKPIAASNDQTCTYPTEAIKKLGELGLMGITVPTEYGGAEMDPLSYVIVIEEISKVCASTGVILSVNNSLVCEVLKKYGTEEQKKKYLVPVAEGSKLGAYCLTEPMSGSDAGTQKTVAVRDGDHYVVNGAKNFITNGLQAEVFILFCMTAPEKKNKGVSAFVVENDFPGFELGKDENKTGIRSTSTCTISFTDMKVPAENLIGKEGEGYKMALSILDGGRVGIAAQAVGIAQAALDEALRYVKERKAFGKPLAKFQGLRWMLADMATDVEMSRLLTYQAAYKKSLGGRYSKEAAIAKLVAAEASSRVTNKALQIHGGYGYTKEYPVERFVRDARVTEIYEGTSEVQRLVIANLVLKEVGV